MYEKITEFLRFSSSSLHSRICLERWFCSNRAFLEWLYYSISFAPSLVGYTGLVCRLQRWRKECLWSKWLHKKVCRIETTENSRKGKSFCPCVLKTYLLRSVVWTHPRDDQRDYELWNACEPRGHRHDERHVLAGDLNHKFCKQYHHCHHLHIPVGRLWSCPWYWRPWTRLLQCRKPLPRGVSRLAL